MAMLQDRYKKEVVPGLQKDRGYKNPMQIPRLVKVVVNMGINSQVDKDTFKVLVEELGRITGQRPVVTLSRLSIANFKLRENEVLGARVTLRGARMWEFMHRFINITAPNIRDFRGIPNRGFDGRGNYTLGLKEHTIFPEMVDAVVQGNDVGMDITFVTSAKDNKGTRELLSVLGLPFAGK